MKVKKRHISVSPDEQVRTLKQHLKGRVVESFYPIDRHDCDCVSVKQAFVNKLSSMSPAQRQDEIARVGQLTCPRSQNEGFKKYKITCSSCKALIATLHATDKNLNSFCNLHYQCRHDNQFWSGCMTVNISPTTGMLGFECTCGQDTRKDDIDGKEFNKRDSKFIVTEVK